MTATNYIEFIQTLWMDSYVSEFETALLSAKYAELLNGNDSLYYFASRGQTAPWGDSSYASQYYGFQTYNGSQKRTGFMLIYGADGMISEASRGIRPMVEISLSSTQLVTSSTTGEEGNAFTLTTE